MSPLQRNIFLGEGYMHLEKKIILGLTSVSHLTVHAQMIVFPTLLLLFHNEFGLGMDRLGFIATIGAFMFGLGAIPAGLLDNKIGGKNLLIIYHIGSVIGCILLSLAKNTLHISFGLGILGLSSSLYHPAGLSIISRRFNKLSRCMAIHGIAGSLGLALGPFIAAFLAEFGSWRTVYGMWAIIQFMLILFTIFFLRTGKETSLISSNYINNKTDKIHLLLYYVTIVCMGFAFGGFTTFMPTLFGSQTSGVFKYFPQTLKAGIFTTIVFGVGMIGQTIGGLLGDKYNRVTLLFWIIILNVPFLFLMGYTTGWILFIFSILLGIIYFSNQPISNALLADLTPNYHRGLSYGIGFFLSFGIGGLAPAICGFIAEKYYLELVFPIVSLTLIPGVFSIWLLKKRIIKTE